MENLKISKKSKREARELSLRVWDILKRHWEIDSKSGIYNVDAELWEIICSMPGQCPLCELFMYEKVNGMRGCRKGCPLRPASEPLGESLCCKEYRAWIDFHAYGHYCTVNVLEEHAQYATKIYNKIKRWKV